MLATVKTVTSHSINTMAKREQLLKLWCKIPRFIHLKTGSL